MRKRVVWIRKPSGFSSFMTYSGQMGLVNIKTLPFLTIKYNYKDISDTLVRNRFIYSYNKLRGLILI